MYCGMAKGSEVINSGRGGYAVAPFLKAFQGLFDLYLFIYCFAAQVLKVCRTPGSTACSRTKMLQLPKVCLKS